MVIHYVTNCIIFIVLKQIELNAKKRGFTVVYYIAGNFLVRTIGIHKDNKCRVIYSGVINRDM